MINTELNEFVNLMQNLKSDFETEINFSLNKFATEILDLNKKQIFLDSKQANDKYIKGSYSKRTEQLNQGNTFTYNGISKQKKQGEGYILLDSNQFFSSFRLDIDKDTFKIQANTTKPKVDLIQKYGDLLGLNDKNFDYITNKIFEMACENLINYLEL